MALIIKLCFLLLELGLINSIICFTIIGLSIFSFLTCFFGKLGGWKLFVACGALESREICQCSPQSSFLHTLSAIIIIKISYFRWTFFELFVVIVKLRPKRVLLTTCHEISHDQWQIFKNKFTFEDASKNFRKMKTKWEARFFEIYIVFLTL